MTALRRTLIEVFGHASFREGQEEIVRAVANGDNVLVVMPTGAGKSICYQLPALARGGTTLVVSPLIALMKDQVDALLRKGIRAAYINSTLTPRERQQRCEDMKRGHLQLIYVAPERFTSGFISLAASSPVRLFAVDEAHCVSQWGHDFRPDYLRLGEVRRALGSPATVALTATATPRVQADIEEILGLSPNHLFVLGFDRKNIALQVLHPSSPEEKLRLLADLVLPGPALVYCATRRNVERVTRFLRDRGIPVGMYHGGMHFTDRARVQDALLSNEIPAIVATNAFGMGLDKPDIRCVLHHDMPRSIEAYYQEIGRAGRDNEPSRAILLYRSEDRGLQEFLIRSSHPPLEKVERVWDALLRAIEAPTDARDHGHLEFDEDPSESRRISLERTRLDAIFSEEEGGARLTDACLRMLLRKGRLRRLPPSSTSSFLKLLPCPASPDPPSGAARMVLTEVRRLLSPRPQSSGPLDRQRLLERLGGRGDVLDACLWSLQRTGFLEVRSPHELANFDVIHPEEPLRLSEDEVVSAILRETDRLDRMAEYAWAPCRRRHILLYFGEKPPFERCETCDACAAGYASNASPAPRLPTPVEQVALCRILGTVSRLGERATPPLLARILTGSREASLLSAGFDRLPSFGRLSEWSFSELEEAFRELSRAGLVTIEHLAFPPDTTRRECLRLTPLGQQSLEKARIEVPIRFSTNPETRRLPSPRARLLPRGSTSSAFQASDLLERLREVRRHVAEEADVPAYVVASNRTLEAMAAERPTTRRAMLALPGMGPRRFARFGEPFLREISTWDVRHPRGRT
jgi:ATP-dependent DNA helicase RecQ